MTMQRGLKITLSGTPATVLSFDDDVLECFFPDGSTRIHVIHLKGIELSASKGKFLLTVHLLRKDLFIWVEEAQAIPVNELIASVQRAIASSRI